MFRLYFYGLLSMFSREEIIDSMANSSAVSSVSDTLAGQNITFFSSLTTRSLPDTNNEQKFIIKVVKTLDLDNRPFIAYLLITEEQNNRINVTKKLCFAEYEIFYQKLVGKDEKISRKLHAEIMQFFALRYLDRPISYIMNDLPLDKEFFTEEDFIEEVPFTFNQLKAKFLRFIPEKLQSKSEVEVEETSTLRKNNG